MFPRPMLLLRPGLGDIDFVMDLRFNSKATNVISGRGGDSQHRAL